MYVRNSHSRARRLLVAGLGVCVIAAMWVGVCAAAQDREHSRNADAKAIVNPVTSDAQSIEAGKKLYQRHCAGCHGPQGKGDGSLALSGGTPSDFTDDKWDYGSSDGEIFVVIRDGVSSDMLAYKDKLTEKEIWHVVNFIRSLGPKPREKEKSVGRARAGGVSPLAY